jgi:hypothetical protein
VVSFAETGVAPHVGVPDTCDRNRATLTAAHEVTMIVAGLNTGIT